MTFHVIRTTQFLKISGMILEGVFGYIRRRCRLGGLGAWHSVRHSLSSDTYIPITHIIILTSWTRWGVFSAVKLVCRATSATEGPPVEAALSCWSSDWAADTGAGGGGGGGTVGEAGVCPRGMAVGIWMTGGILGGTICSPEGTPADHPTRGTPPDDLIRGTPVEGSHITTPVPPRCGLSVYPARGTPPGGPIGSTRSGTVGGGIGPWFSFLGSLSVVVSVCWQAVAPPPSSTFSIFPLSGWSLPSLNEDFLFFPVFLPLALFRLASTDCSCNISDQTTTTITFLHPFHYEHTTHARTWIIMYILALAM